MKRLLLAVAVAWLAPATVVDAQVFPDRPVKVIVPQTPGGANDALGRLIAQKLSEKWGKPVVVENRSGAGGNIGTDFVAKSTPDGYTWLVTYAGTHAINASLFTLPFDPEKDLAAVATIATVPFVLVTNVDLPAKDVRSFVALAREKPDVLNYGAQNGAVNHLLGVMLNRAASIQTMQVPYRGAADVLTDMMGGRLQFHFASLPSIVGYVKSGRVRALAVPSAKRSPTLPDVPTKAELGYPGLTSDAWYGVLVPAGVPKPFVRQIHAAINEALATKEFVDRLEAMGTDPLVTTPAQFAKIASDDIAKWRVVIKEAGVKLE